LQLKLQYFIFEDPAIYEDDDADDAPRISQGALRLFVFCNNCKTYFFLTYYIVCYTIYIVTKCLLNDEHDFSQKTHQLQQWFGLTEFVVISSNTDEEEHVEDAAFVSEEMARSLMSSLTVALVSSKKPISWYVFLLAALASC